MTVPPSYVSVPPAVFNRTLVRLPAKVTMPAHIATLVEVASTTFPVSTHVFVPVFFHKTSTPLITEVASALLLIVNPVASVAVPPPPRKLEDVYPLVVYPPDPTCMLGIEVPLVLTWS